MLEPALARLIDAELAAQWPNDTETAANYKRQYGGLILNGRRIIYVNGLHGSDGPPVSEQVQLGAETVTLSVPDWHISALMICDGGPITFGVEYDVATRRFSNFQFNGVA